MKSAHKIAIYCLAICGHVTLQAQWMPKLTQYPVVSQPSATFAQVLDTVTTYAEATDTAEGGEQDELTTFRNFWHARVTANDSSGQNMFQQYFHALGMAISARTSGTSCTGSGYAGAWQPANDSIQTQNSGFVWAVWAGSGADSNLILAGSDYT